jgi:hypothetical protein
MNAPNPPKVSKKVSKPLTIEQRVDLLMREGVDHPEKWATVHGYVEPEQMLNSPICGECTWQDEWQRLRTHHLEEMNFLFDVISELVKRYDLLDEQMASIVVEGYPEDD